MRALTILSTSAILLSSIFSYNLHAAEHEIKMLNSGKDGSMVFEPGTIKVEVGDTVKFISTDAGHNSESKFAPEGATAWKGEIGKDITVTIDKEGIYIYSCSPHTVMAMVGVIQAGKASNEEGAKKKAKELANTFIMNKDRLDKYLETLKSTSNDDKKKTDTEKKKEDK
ncbi:MAG TPA: pseudoazurin [Leucothrix sp.]|nr:pseudoazurin [Leucothrix sp.]